jgi:hypothetical protein
LIAPENNAPKPSNSAIREYHRYAVDYLQRNFAASRGKENPVGKTVVETGGPDLPGTMRNAETHIA